MKLKKNEDQSVDTLPLLRIGNKTPMEGVGRLHQKKKKKKKKNGAGLWYTVAINTTTVQVLARIWSQTHPSGFMQIKVPAD
jgi:hypothetical protein